MTGRLHHPLRALGARLLLNLRAHPMRLKPGTTAQYPDARPAHTRRRSKIFEPNTWQHCPRRGRRGRARAFARALQQTRDQQPLTPRGHKDLAMNAAPVHVREQPSTRPRSPRERKKAASCSSSPPTTAPTACGSTTGSGPQPRLRCTLRAGVAASIVKVRTRLIPPPPSRVSLLPLLRCSVGRRIRSTLHLTRPAISTWAHKSERNDR